ncbi:hypothetical protein VNI00_017487 [Paramarasmius palmivorus]|uniref:Uncharacterized protein n=1 Tax=Paramarasmius palmivorus TaxID=297713 RepID=A0AAW0B4W4_9AGAR
MASGRESSPESDASRAAWFRELARSKPVYHINPAGKVIRLEPTQSPPPYVPMSIMREEAKRRAERRRQGILMRQLKDMSLTNSGNSTTGNPTTGPSA